MEKVCQSQQKACFEHSTVAAIAVFYDQRSSGAWLAALASAWVPLQELRVSDGATLPGECQLVLASPEIAGVFDIDATVALCIALSAMQHNSDTCFGSSALLSIAA
jgi:hypothetical protein